MDDYDVADVGVDVDTDVVDDAGGRTMGRLSNDDDDDDDNAHNRSVDNLHPPRSKILRNAEL